MNQESIISGCINNKRHAQEVLYKMYFDSMWRMCSRYTTDDDQLMSIINNGFLKVFQKINTYDGHGSLEGWIRKVVFHALSDFFRKENRYINRILLDKEGNQEGSSEAPVALSNLKYDDIIQMLDEVPAASRKVFVLYAIEGYSHKEISEKLSISVGTSKWHLSESRKQLRKLLQDTYKYV